MILGLALALTLQASPTPSASTTPAPACSPRFRDVEVITATQPNFPQSLVGKFSGSVSVLMTVDVDAAGKVTATKVVQSSGFPALDAAAVIAADSSTYSPKIVDCKPVAGRYTFMSTFE